MNRIARSSISESKTGRTKTAQAFQNRDKLSIKVQPIKRILAEENNASNGIKNCNIYKNITRQLYEIEE